VNDWRHRGSNPGPLALRSSALTTRPSTPTFSMWVDGQMDGWVDGRTGGWADEWIGRWVGVRVNERVSEWVDGWVEASWTGG